MPNFCKECGSPLEAGMSFCSNCGAKIGGPQAPQEAPSATQQQASYQQPQAQAQQPQHVYEDAYAEEKAQGVDWKDLRTKITIGKPEVTFISKRKLIIIAIVVVIVLLLALFSK